MHPNHYWIMTLLFTALICMPSCFVLSSSLLINVLSSSACPCNQVYVVSKSKIGDSSSTNADCCFKTIQGFHHNVFKIIKRLRDKKTNKQTTQQTSKQKQNKQPCLTPTRVQNQSLTSSPAKLHSWMIYRELRLYLQFLCWCWIFSW